jgi:hypothetical protein
MPAPGSEAEYQARLKRRREETERQRTYYERLERESREGYERAQRGGR